MPTLQVQGIASVNHDALDIDIKAAIGAVYTGHSGPSLRNGTPELALHFTDQATAENQDSARTIALAHNPAIQTPAQELAAAQTITREQLVAYLRAQLTSATPDTPATIKATVQTAIDDSPKLQNAITNAATLFGYNTGTNVGYLQAVFQVLGVFV